MEVLVLSVCLVVWAAGMAVTGWLIERPEKGRHHRSWWDRQVWRAPRIFRAKVPGTLCWAMG